MGSRVEAEGRMARSEGGASPSAGCNDRATPPTALLPRAVDGCVDFGVGRRCSLGRDHCGYRHCASRLGQRQNPQQRDPSRYFNGLLTSEDLILCRGRFSAKICFGMSKRGISERHRCRAVKMFPTLKQTNQTPQIITMKYALLVHVNRETVDQFKDANAKAAAAAAGRAYGEALRAAGIFVAGAGLESPETTTVV